MALGSHVCRQSAAVAGTVSSSGRERWGLEFCALITDDINFIWTVVWVGRPKKGSEPPTSTVRVEGAQHLTGSSPCSDPFPAVQRIAPALPFLSIPPRVKPSNDLRAHPILHPCNSANQTRLRQI
ncbi:unnamed protein product [Natator depressus]